METILHISDLRFGWEGDNPARKAERKVCLDGLLSEIQKLGPGWKPTIICLTGDVGWSGAASDYAETRQWLDRLMALCGLNYERLVACPGNHEVIRPQARKIARPGTAREADEVLEPPVAEQYIRVFSGYNDFCNEIEERLFEDFRASARLHVGIEPRDDWE